MQAYIKNVANALLGKTQQTESFAAGAQPTSGPAAFGVVLLVVVLSLMPAILFAYGASSLSYCLNKSMGWAILCFLFPGFYYPYYAIMLNPLCATPVSGGARRHR
jgi:hypothetical protein